jgi:hypothetical protein
MVIILKKEGDIGATGFAVAIFMHAVILWTDVPEQTGVYEIAHKFRLILVLFSWLFLLYLV